MKKEFIEKLICPACKKYPLSLSWIDKEDWQEIHKGTMRCQACGKEYPIKSGIAVLLDRMEMQHQYVPGAIRKSSQPPIVNQEMVFERKALAYRENLDKNWVMNSTANFDQVFNHLQLTGSENVLEIGAGTCWAIQRFAQRGCKCVAMDIIDHHKLELADYWFKDKGVYFERIIADMNQLIFRENTFDIVFSISSIMYSRDVLSAFREINRVLKPYGKMILISEPRLPFYWQRSVYKRLGSGNAYTTFEWYSFIRKSGFKVVKNFFAQSTRMRFNNPELIDQKDRWYYLVAKFLSPLWKMRFLRVLNLDGYSRLFSNFIPLPLMIIAVRERRTRRILFRKRRYS